jgi:Zn-dependent protease with chaperone function
MKIPAIYFDGRTSRRHAVELAVQDGIAVVEGDVQRTCPLGELRVSERARHAARKVTFPDGAYLEVIDTAGFNALLAATGHRDSLVVRMQQSWRATLLAAVATVALVAAGYRYGLPAAADIVAKALPESVERAIGRGALDVLDQHLLMPTALPPERRAGLIARFRALVPPREGAPAYEIVFRKSRIGPNAFALPSGQIVLTDEIVTLMNDDDAIAAVLAHELGHLHERHLLRRVVQSSAAGAAAALLFGDVSSVVAGLPVLLVDQKYSRDAEREADDYALAMLKANGIPARALAAAFEKLAAQGTAKGPSMPPYLSSHPPAAERIDRILNQH